MASRVSRLPAALWIRAERAALAVQGWSDIRRLRQERASFPTPKQIDTAKRDLAPAYEVYVRQVSTPEMAISFQTAALILALCRTEKVTSAMDLGSGFSSYVLRRWAQESDCEVYSLDDDPAWLAKTEHFLAEQGVGVEHLELWPTDTNRRVDLVVHDLANGARREVAMPFALEASSRLCLFDDAQHGGHRATMIKTCADAGVKLYSLRSITVDQIWRYSMLGVK